MKKIFFLAVLLTTSLTFCQNIFQTNGNVGIGAIDPSSKLEILETADSKPQGVVAATKSILKLSRRGTPGYSYNENAEFRIGHGENNYYGSKLDLYINGSTNSSSVPDQHVMTWNHDGNVGIGTTKPTEKLEIYNSDTSPGIISLKSLRNDFGYVDVGRISAKQASVEVSRIGMPRGGGTNTGYLTFWTKADNTADLTEKVRISEKGNVGIGTTTPNAKLEVTGGGITSSFSNINNTITQRINTANPAITLGFGYTVSDTPFIQSYNSVILSSNHLIFNPFGGNVGIGTTIPDSKLTVNGDIHATEVKVTSSVPAPDYVFEKYYLGQSSLKPDYTLLTLSEVEKFTEANHHLPNVPSAKEIKENGLLLGEMSNVLLQKIEELTLYIIEQNKNMEKQNEKILVLEEKVRRVEKVSK